MTDGGEGEGTVTPRTDSLTVTVVHDDGRDDRGERGWGSWARVPGVVPWTSNPV